MATLAEWKTTLRAENSSLTKMVDGVSITLTTDEYNDTIDGWAQVSFDKEVADNIIANGGESANYAQYRAGAYPSIGEQLDKLYHDIDDGKLGSDAKTGTWYATIKATKDKYAKPS